VRLLSLVFVTLLVEATLQLMTAVSSTVREAIVPDAVGWTVVDPKRGEMPNPRYHDHDAWGFRNASVPAAAWAVALGDSQTYGTGVARMSAWPAALQSLAGRDVYSMAFGGWGQVKEASLLDDALRLSPELVLVAVYMGNDFADCYRRTYLTPDHPEFRSIEPDVLAQIAEAEAASPLYQVVNDLTRSPGVAGGAKQLAKRWSRHIRILGLMRKLYDVARGAGQSELSGVVSESAWGELRADASKDATKWAFESGALRTVFTPHLRHCALDADDPRMVEGLRVSLEAVSAMAAQCHQANARLVVVLIPTKEWAFQGVVEQAGLEPPAIYTTLVRKEATLRRTYLQACRDRALDTIDVGPALQGSLLAGEAAYSADSDGHPTPLGHHVIADTVKKGLRALGLVE
jgi:lysophospholipase L1-like esterase